MAGSFTSPSSSGGKMKVSKANRPKRSASGEGSAKRSYPITDSFASSGVPGFASRKASSHTKSGFNSKPAKHSGKGF